MLAMTFSKNKFLSPKKDRALKYFSSEAGTKLKQNIKISEIKKMPLRARVIFELSFYLIILR